MLRKNEALERQALTLQVNYRSALSEVSKLKDHVAELETQRDEVKNREADLSWSLDKEQTRREKAENMVLELRQKITVLESQLGTKRTQGVQGVAQEVAATASNISHSKVRDDSIPTIVS